MKCERETCDDPERGPWIIFNGEWTCLRHLPPIGRRYAREFLRGR
jgi:hypothetical protein